MAFWGEYLLLQGFDFEKRELFCALLFYFVYLSKIKGKIKLTKKKKLLIALTRLHFTEKRGVNKSPKMNFYATFIEQASTFIA